MATDTPASPPANNEPAPARAVRAPRKRSSTVPAQTQASSKPRTRPAAARATKTVAVTGAAGAVGSRLAALLRDDPQVAKVVAIDVRRGDLDGVVWRIGDVRDPVLSKRLVGVDVVVHLAVDWSLDRDPAERSAVNVNGTRTVVTAAAAAGVSRVVLITSAQVYGASPENAVPLAEDAPLLAPPEGILADLLEMEEVAHDARRVHPGVQVTVVRPAALVGPGVDTLVTRHFASPRLLCIRDTTPHWQFCHVADLASALVHVALGRADVDGRAPQFVTVGSDGWLDQAEVELVSGRKRIDVPAALAFATAERLHRLGMTPAPASELMFVIHPWVIPSTVLRESGWVATYDNTTALHAILEQVEGDRALVGRRVGMRDATVAGASAAGATAAVLGAAALVIRARRARGR